MDFIEFKNTYFDGNEETAFEQLAKESYNREYTYTKTHNNLKIILDSMSSETASRYMKVYGKEIAKNPKYFEDTIEIAFDCATIKMSTEEVQAMDKNPFSKKLLFNLILCISEILLFFAIALILEKFNLVKSILLLPTAILLFHSMYEFSMIFINLRRFFCFRKIKRFLEKYKKE